MKKIIIDTNCTIDNALALLYAVKTPDKLNIIGITTVFGKVSARQSAMNASYILKIGEREDIPVGIGEELPLGSSVSHKNNFFYDIGVISDHMGESIIKKPAIDCLINTLEKATEKITIITMGPLTNIGLILSIKPKIIKNIEKIIVMGGAYQVNGNITQSAELNIYLDTIAAEKVFSADCPVIMVGLDVSSKILINKEFLSNLYSHKKYGWFIKHVGDSYYQCHQNNHNIYGKLLQDLSAIFFALDETLFETIREKVYVCLHGKRLGQTYAASHMNAKRFEMDNKKRIIICTGIDELKVVEKFMSIFGN